MVNLNARVEKEGQGEQSTEDQENTWKWDNSSALCCCAFPSVYKEIEHGSTSDGVQIHLP